MKQTQLIPKDVNIKSIIYEIRGQKVMLDSDLAKLYGYTVKAFNQQVQRNIERFPSDFMFQLTKEETDELLRSQFSTLNNETLRSQNVTLEKNDSRSQIATLDSEPLRSQFSTLNSKGNKKGMHFKYYPYAFTEQGVYMLATVLKSELAIRQSILIIRAFKELKDFYIQNNYLLDRVINNEIKLLEYKDESDKKFNQIFDYISDHKESSQKIFYDGQIFEADDMLVKIIKKANKEIILIDNYIDIKTLELLSYKNKDVKVDIYTSKRGNYLKKSIVDDFNNEHGRLNITYNDIFHDRYLLLDKKEIYLVGASLKDVGVKCFSLIKLDNRNIKEIIKKLSLS